MQLKKRYLGLIGIAILAFIFYSVDISSVAKAFLEIEPGFFAAALFVSLFGVVLKGFKYKAVVKAHNQAISLADSTKYFLIGFFISLATPGRVGEIARALYANQKINNLGKSVSTVVFDRAIDLTVLITMGLASALFFSLSLQIEAIPLGIIVLVATGFAVAVFLASRKSLVRVFLKPVFQVLVPERFKQGAKAGFEQFYEGAGEAMQNKKQLAIATATSIFTWLVGGLGMYLFLLSLSLQVPFYFVFLMMPTIALVEMLPISFSGLGTREAANIFLLGIYGIPAAEAVAFSMLIFAAGHVLNAAIGFALFTTESGKIDLAGFQ